MSRSVCSHSSARDIATHGYTGSVAHHPHTEENRAAHGNVCVTEECVSCGSRRRYLVNGRHYEFGTWGPSRQEREAAVQRARASARAAIAAVATLVATHPDGRTATIRVDEDGMVVSDDLSHAELGAVVRQAPEWLSLAQVARRAVLAMQDAEVTS